VHRAALREIYSLTKRIERHTPMRCWFLQVYELRENSAIGIEKSLSDGCGKEAVHLGGGHCPEPSLGKGNFTRRFLPVDIPPARA